mmetsp:Transcript_40344/g.64065  ORF Transcript_40344/g.64065 Transcript_40344/m.64065 type:complete len:226 (-) Transcript_40344:315-992(-)
MTAILLGRIMYKWNVAWLCGLHALACRASVQATLTVQGKLVVTARKQRKTHPIESFRQSIVDAIDHSRRGCYGSHPSYCPRFQHGFLRFHRVDFGLMRSLLFLLNNWIHGPVTDLRKLLQDLRCITNRLATWIVSIDGGRVTQLFYLHSWACTRLRLCLLAARCCWKVASVSHVGQMRLPPPIDGRTDVVGTIEVHRRIANGAHMHLATSSDCRTGSGKKKRRSE